jgi:hypothetical protein
MQSKAKVCSPPRRVAMLKKACCAGDPKSSSFYWRPQTWGWSGLENWINAINFQRLGYTSSIPPKCWAGKFLALDGQGHDGCHFPWAMGPSGQQDCCMSQVNPLTSAVRRDCSSVSKCPWLLGS